MKRDLSKLSGTSNAQVNSGTIGQQKDKVIYLDPNAEILYDPEQNIREGKVVKDDIESLIELRLTLDGAEQLQPIRVYPLPPDKLDSTKPAMKYGIAFGHRRTLACRLTKEDHPSISARPRKVAATVDVNWLVNKRSYRLRCQITENTQRSDLNYVEHGQALLDYQQSLGVEEGRAVSQRELMEVYGLKEKTVFALLKAAQCSTLAKEACHRKLLTDLDTINTFDVICTLNPEMAKAIFVSLQKEGAPRTRSLMRQARALAEKEDYTFDKASWTWPESIQDTPAPVSAPPLAQTTATQREAENTGTGSVPDSGVSTLSRAGGENLRSKELEQGDNNPLQGQQLASTEPKLPVDPPQGELVGASSSTGDRNSHKTENPAGSAEQQGEGAGTSPKPSDQRRQGTQDEADAVVMVSFKMGVEAPHEFNGELMVNLKAKTASNGIVSYLSDGREELIEVPLKLITLVSISHQ